MLARDAPNQEQARHRVCPACPPTPSQSLRQGQSIAVSDMSSQQSIQLLVQLSA